MDESWMVQAPALGSALTVLQGDAAVDGARSVPAALRDQGVEVEPEYTVKPRAVGGFAGAGFDPVQALAAGAIITKARIGAGWDSASALEAGGKALSGVLQTAMADAGRQGQMLAVHSRPKVGYVRMLTPPSCSRCAILAGTSSGREAFPRHPRCDCRAIPGLEGMEQDLTMDTAEYFESLPTSAELAEMYPGMTVGERRAAGHVSQEDVFTVAGARAIRDGANVNQIVNARRGMHQIQRPGSVKWLVTPEGTASRRGSAFRSMGNAGYRGRSSKDNVMRYRLDRQRLMPETIYQVARDQDDVKRLLKAYGYI